MQLLLIRGGAIEPLRTQMLHATQVLVRFAPTMKYTKNRNFREDRLLDADRPGCIQDQTERYLETAYVRSRLQARYDWDSVVMDANARRALLDSGQEFELVLSNLVMPSLDGIELLQRLKDKHPDVPAVMVTAVQDTPIALTAICNGA